MAIVERFRRSRGFRDLRFLNREKSFALLFFFFPPLNLSSELLTLYPSKASSFFAIFPSFAFYPSTMPASKPLTPVPKPPRAGRETSWGMMDIMADIENPAMTTTARGEYQQKPTNRGSAMMKARTIKMAARATANVPPAGIGRESSWGCVDVMEMLDLEEDDQAAAVDAIVAPPMPPKASVVLKRSTSRGNTSRLAIQAQLSPKRL